jgi:hypothetical protein
MPQTVQQIKAFDVSGGKVDRGLAVVLPFKFKSLKRGFYRQTWLQGGLYGVYRSGQDFGL